MCNLTLLIFIWRTIKQANNYSSSFTEVGTHILFWDHLGTTQQCASNHLLGSHWAAMCNHIATMGKHYFLENL